MLRRFALARRVAGAGPQGSPGARRFRFASPARAKSIGDWWLGEAQRSDPSRRSSPGCQISDGLSKQARLTLPRHSDTFLFAFRLES
jgi:hypothetical protein